MANIVKLVNEKPEEKLAQLVDALIVIDNVKESVQSIQDRTKNEVHKLLEDVITYANETYVYLLFL